MGDWIKNNKFESGLLLVVLLIAGAVYYLAGGWNERYEKAQAEHAQAVNNLNQANQLKPSPTDANEQAFRKALVDYRKKVDDLQKGLLAYRPKTLDKISPAEFQANLNKDFETLKALFSEKSIEFPEEKWRLGFEEYMASPPRDEATAILNYELGGLTYLYSTLAATNPSALLNVYRDKLRIETGGNATPAPTGRSSRRSSPAREKAKEPYEKLPLELSFRASEPAVRKFLTELVNSKDYFFLIRSVRIQNEQSSKPPRKDAVKFEAEAVDTPFGDTGDFVFPPPEEAPPEEVPPGGEAPPAGEEAPAAPADPIFPPAAGGDEGDKGERILGRVLGAEELNVFLQLELLLFDAGASLPEINE